jgi:hypothetical protein
MLNKDGCARPPGERALRLHSSLIPPTGMSPALWSSDPNGVPLVTSLAAPRSIGECFCAFFMILLLRDDAMAMTGGIYAGGNAIPTQ